MSLRGALIIITYIILRVPYIIIIVQYIYPNPILIIKAPIVGFRVEGLSVVHGGHQSKLFGFTVWRLTTSPALTSVC